jgi:hypothetical protein
VDRRVTPSNRLPTPIARRFVRAAAAGAAFFVLILSFAAIAQYGIDANGPGIAKAVSTAKGPKDFNGVWVLPKFQPRFSNNPPFQPWAETKFKAYKPQDDPQARCLPAGWPRALNAPYPVEIFQLRKVTLMHFEVPNVLRRIYTDGRKHPVDADPTWYGHSIGWWEGNVFVVDTVNIKPDQFLDSPGDPKSDALHTVERWHLLDGGLGLQVDMTIDDPKTYTKTWATTRTLRRTADEIMEWSCEDNNRNDPDKPGPLNLTSAPGPTPYEAFTGIVSDRDDSKKAAKDKSDPKAAPTKNPAPQN